MHVRDAFKHRLFQLAGFCVGPVPSTLAQPQSTARQVRDPASFRPDTSTKQTPPQLPATSPVFSSLARLSLVITRSFQLHTMRSPLTITTIGASIIGSALADGSGPAIVGPSQTLFSGAVAVATEAPIARATPASNRGNLLLRKRDLCERECEWDAFCVVDRGSGFGGCCGDQFTTCEIATACLDYSRHQDTITPTGEEQKKTKLCPKALPYCTSSFDEVESFTFVDCGVAPATAAVSATATLTTESSSLRPTFFPSNGTAGLNTTTTTEGLASTTVSVGFTITTTEIRTPTGVTKDSAAERAMRSGWGSVGLGISVAALMMMLA
ncbi:hypothetical protein BJ508DRAFT_416456 [Ascobolus immersus RN42]|uniref:Uncharacterized protein n=1 Tax=Ascobolus immersus RN42 TaxID=1160509 RepID=A0A3N4I3A7_ASCIM|nr:hypothetical protein BJ508DRAFT_416456 [Ascobolus immersus RN42]